MKLECISVGICTYKRPLLLERLLSALQEQKTGGGFIFNTVVVDNDVSRSAFTVVERLKKSMPDLHYLNEPVANIALARNRVVNSTRGEFVAFIDDDEFPSTNWLYNLYTTCKSKKCDGVLGPVKPAFEGTPPQWLVKSGLCDRVSFHTGTLMEAKHTRTGNALICRSVFCRGEVMFNPVFGKIGGEDTDFFTRAISRGFKFVWCQEAPVYEWVLPERWSKTFYLKRAFLRGQVNHISQRERPFGFRCKVLARSALTFSFYSLFFPLVLISGEHIRMKFLNSYMHHAGRLATALRLSPIKNR